MVLRAILLVVFTLALVITGSTDDAGLKVGDQARDFELKNVDGKMVSLADFDDAKGYIIVFTCNTCPYAKAYEDRIVALHKKYAPQGYPVVAINPNDAAIQPGDSYEAMQQRAQEKALPYPYLLDDTQQIATFYGATRTPHVYVLDGDLRVQYIGAIDNNYKDAQQANERYVESAVEALKGGQTINPSTTKAIGCGIKWREQ
jgi:peroxiredoxin